MNSMKKSTGVDSAMALQTDSSYKLRFSLKWTFFHFISIFLLRSKNYKQSSWEGIGNVCLTPLPLLYQMIFDFWEIFVRDEDKYNVCAIKKIV